MLLLRLPFLNQPIQGDDAYYLAIAEHAQIEPLHPTHFQHISTGIVVDMRGMPHPPLNGWYLGLLLAIFGDVREPVFHLLYMPFSLIAALAAYSIACRYSQRPLWATLLFLAAPAFVINGTSLETDLPHLAFFLAAIALFLSDRLILAAVSMALAALTAYQAAVLIPILGLHLWQKRSRSVAHWLVLLSPAIALVAYQAYERLSTGAVPAAVLTGYFQTYGLQSLINKARNAAALTVHLGWIVSPLVAPVRWWLALIAVGAAFIDASPLFWVPFALGVGTLVYSRRLPWIPIFFAAALVIFFAGSARYLLPLALPVAILAADRGRWLALGFGSHLALSLALAFSNYQHWDAYRKMATPVTWINAEWGLRWYEESLGALPLVNGQAVRPGQSVMTSALSFPIPYTTGGGVGVAIAEHEVKPTLPLRLFAVDSRSAYSSAQHGLRAFDISTLPADRVTVAAIRERKPELSYLPVNAPQADSQIVSGVYQADSPANAWRWSADRVVVLVKAPAAPSRVEATFRIIDQSPARTVALLVNGQVVAQQTYTGPGLYTLASSAPVALSEGTATVTLTADRTFRAPGDNRNLALILTGLGFVSRP